ncbi:MAG: GNAT family protein [bacterium]|nr:GNAT family protein [bacterium]
MQLKTTRLVLRPIIQKDFIAVHAYASDAESVLYTGFGPNTEENTRQFINECNEREAASPRLAYDFAIIESESGLLIGDCGIFKDSHRNEGGLGIILHKNYWRKGYGTEVTHELLRFGFEELKLHRIFGNCDSRNSASIDVFKKLNMRQEGYFVKRRIRQDGWCDEVQFALLDEEWHG